MAILASRRGTRPSSRNSETAMPRRGAVRGGMAALLGSTAPARRSRLALAALAALALGQPANAQTVGNDFEGSGVGNLLGLVGGGGVLQPGNGMPVDFGASVFGYIANPYMLVGVGNGGTFSINYATNFTAPFTTLGMITFGNLIGSTRLPGDDRRPFNSAGFGGGEVFPVPGEYEVVSGGFLSYDYPTYLRARVDQTVVNVVAPVSRFENSVLFGTVDLAAGTTGPVTLRQEIRLYRTTAQLRWIVRNTDTVAHTVSLRYVVNHGTLFNQNIFNGRFFTAGATFYEDPIRGLTNRGSVITGPDVPDTLSFYGARYEDPAQPIYSARHTFRGAGATPPSRIVIANNFELRPRDLGTFDVVPERQPSGQIAVASYWGPLTLTPGQSQEVITYYGNGTPSQRLDNDFVTSLDGPEALGYNALAPNDPTIVGNTGQTITNEGVRYLTPNPFQIFGGIYNRVPSNPSDKVDLTNVTASLTLPTGLAFANLPGTTTSDSALKVLGNGGAVLSDRGADTSWYVRPTGEAFGALTYQMSISTAELGGRQQTRSINVPAVPFRAVTATAFQMVGFPFEFDPVESNNGDPATVINTLTRPADEPVAFYQWIPDPNVPGDGNYQIVNRLQNGIGYMYRPQLSRTIVAKGVKPLARQAEPGVLDLTNVPQRQIIIERGWNMIANPYVYDLPLRLLRFAQPTEVDVNGAPIPDVSSQNLLSAINGGLVQAGVFTLNTGTNSYDSLDTVTASLRPWEAYWIYATNRVILIYPVPTQRQSVVLPGDDVTPSPSTRKRTVQKVVAKPTVLTAPSTQDNWKQQLVARRGDSVDRAIWIGATNKNESENRRAIAKPPVPVENYVYVGIVKDAKGSRYARDIRAGRGTQTWNLEVKTDKDGPVMLTWPDAGRLSRRLNLKVREVATGKTHALRSSSSMTINVTRAQPTLLEVTSSVEASSPLLLSGVQSVPGGRASGGGREFSFRITRDATVHGSITTITGKPVAGLGGGKAFSRGQGRIHWSGRAANGSPLPPGPYRLELEARDADGNVSPASHVFMTLE